MFSIICFVSSNLLQIWLLLAPCVDASALAACCGIKSIDLSFFLLSSVPSGLQSRSGHLGSGADGCQYTRRGPPQLRHQHALQKLLVCLREKRLIAEFLLPAVSPPCSETIQQADTAAHLHIYSNYRRRQQQGGTAANNKHISLHQFSHMVQECPSHSSHSAPPDCS